jgi:cardiolipin synthase
MTTDGWIITLLLFTDLCIRIGLCVRVIMRRRPVGVSLSWLFVIMLLPFAGAFIYLILGELRLGKKRSARLNELEEPYDAWRKDLRDGFTVHWNEHGDSSEPLARLAENAAGICGLPGNSLELIGDWEKSLRRIIADIESAQRTCHMEFYIWHPGGIADEVVGALIDASRRGVVCRVLLDAVGSSVFLRSALARDLEKSGVQLENALSGGLFHKLVTRYDLRMHRKIVVIDGEIAFTGSLNLVDPRFFKQDSDVGQWVDAMVRLQGPAVEAMAITFMKDWELERHEGIESLRATADVQRLDPVGKSTVQVIPTGPAIEGDAIQILLMTIYAARRELIITTPYFVADEALLTALISAERRGVDVTLILPARVDSILVPFASQAHMGELLAAGVEVRLFHGGLLHTKSITVDGELCLFGSLNMDPRSLYLNFEITLAVYDHSFTSDLRSLQQSYVAKSTAMKLDDWANRSRPQKFADNIARLLSPLL